MKAQLKKLALLPLFCGLVLTSACSNDDDNPTENGNAEPFIITAIVENGNDYNDLINTVAMIGLTTVHYEGIHPPQFFESSEMLASGNYSNGGFIITLPATLDAKFFHSFVDDIPEGIAISDRNIKMTTILPLALNDSGTPIGIFSLGQQEQSRTTEALFVYADRDVTITGTIATDGPILSTETWNVSLKRGWNKWHVSVIFNEGVGGIVVSSEYISGLRWRFGQGGFSNAPLNTLRGAMAKTVCLHGSSIVVK